MKNNFRLHLFQGYGIELEYIIVDRDSLNIKPVADELLKSAAGKYVSDFVNGPVTWSNEVVLHVIELKCSEPTSNLAKLDQDFHENVLMINDMLKKFNARLMPTSAHPWMNPQRETFLWPHDNSEVYELYDKIFNCKGHGWSNLQSVHLNLPFYDDEEFARLHMAIRAILPILPALTASSPILENKFTGFQDKRMVYYENNQKKIPSIAGKIIPERIISKRQYHKHVFDKIEKDISPYDPQKILNPIWLNSRGAIARFDRGSIEIRVMDIQESHKADLAIITLVVEVLKLMVKGKVSNHENLLELETDALAQILKGTIKDGGDYIINDKIYLSALGLTSKEKMSASELWLHLYKQIPNTCFSGLSQYKTVLDDLFVKGNLSSRILKMTNGIFSDSNLKLIYQELCENLNENKMFAQNETLSYHS